MNKVHSLNMPLVAACQPWRTLNRLRPTFESREAPRISGPEIKILIEYSRRFQCARSADANSHDPSHIPTSNSSHPFPITSRIDNAWAHLRTVSRLEVFPVAGHDESV